MTLKSLNSGIDVTFCWILANTGINGNEIADQLAKNTTKKKGYRDLSPIRKRRN